MEFKDKLRALRQERRLSQQALADAIYISRSAVAKWENGLGLPSQTSLEALCNYFGVSESYFATEEPEKILREKEQTIRWLLLSVAAAALVAVLILATVFIFHYLQHPPRIGFTSQAAAGSMAEDPCVQTKHYDFYLAGIALKNAQGEIIGYTVSRIAAVRKVGPVYYREALIWTTRSVFHEGKLVGTLATCEDSEGFHNIFLSNSSQLLLPLLEFDTVSANGKLCTAQQNAYFRTDEPVETLEIRGFLLELSRETATKEM